MTEITDPEAAADAAELAGFLADAGAIALRHLGFEVSEPAGVKIDIGTADHPDEARITLTWPLPDLTPGNPAS